MYPLKPVVSLPGEIPLPNNMYSLPRIQGDIEGNNSTNAQFTEDGFELIDPTGRQEIDLHLNIVEAQQMRILKNICDLRSDIEALGITIRISDVVKPKPIYPNKIFLKNPISSDIVVFAHPSSPPYSILALQRLWRETRFYIKCHNHSTAPTVAKNDFLDKALGKTMYVPAHHIDVTIIWKDVKDIQLVTKAYDYPFVGEAHIVRYLSRLLEEYRYENPSTVAETNAMDSIMDFCSHLFCEEPKNLDDVAEKIASYLGKNPWLVNLPKPSVADITAWSTLRRLQYTIKLPNLKKWFDECEKVFLTFY
ncbi:hypothetical protein QAD02_023190 [Eretmocerus hayati]|uniref:Uncharacterized protein n=1 Tax=Eretmocerus hayati TaxID=131215 RepID=A0ACC2PV41_9HYME|nr:hypothetical protein QAD02_023190 [Eretmocerus hayati]